jgi:pyrroloquinoline quinone (PQQ) biosynthesis protein C
MGFALAQDLQDFARANALTGLTGPSVRAIREGRSGYTVHRGRQFLQFQDRINRELLQHRVITRNAYTAWFERGEQTQAQLRAFIVQFSVFSNQFLVAQLQKMINADTLEGMRASKEILANEIGVVFNPHGPRGPAGTDAEYDPERVGTEGTVQGGTFRFEAGHFEWLYQIAKKLGLGFHEIGRRRFGTPSTLFFCDELIRLYGGEDYRASRAASYAVENWAAAGFWEELIEGLRGYNRRHATDLPLGFFLWHSRLEAQHARHTQEELEEGYFPEGLDEDAFIRTGNEMLEAVAAFWDGLDAQRKAIA